jgi:hypothetical protein
MFGTAADAGDFQQGIGGGFAFPSSFCGRLDTKTNHLGNAEPGPKRFAAQLFVELVRQRDSGPLNLRIVT